jgi:hypothetical protein
MAVQVDLQYMFIGVLLIDRAAWKHCAKSPRLIRYLYAVGVRFIEEEAER